MTMFSKLKFTIHRHQPVRTPILCKHQLVKYMRTPILCKHQLTNQPPTYLDEDTDPLNLSSISHNTILNCVLKPVLKDAPKYAQIHLEVDVKITLELLLKQSFEFSKDRP